MPDLSIYKAVKNLVVNEMKLDREALVAIINEHVDAAISKFLVSRNAQVLAMVRKVMFGHLERGGLLGDLIRDEVRAYLRTKVQLDVKIAP